MGLIMFPGSIDIFLHLQALMTDPIPKRFLNCYLESHIIRVVFRFLSCLVRKESFSGPIDLLRSPPTVC